MINAREERVRELIRSLESVQVRNQDLGKKESAFEGRSFSLMKPGQVRTMQRIPGATPATTSSAPSITRGSLSVMIAISELKAAPKPPQSLPPCQAHAHAVLMER